MRITESILSLPYLNPLGVWVALKLEEGKYLVQLARKSIEYFLTNQTIIDASDAPESLKQKQGAFVTLQTYPEKILRGCIGYVIAAKPLAQTVAECAVQAAVGDPRFPHVKKEELPGLVIEVSVLTPMMKLEAEEPELYAKAIEVGRDGLMIEDGYYSGLLLPQVAAEKGWNEEEFLAQTCVKAGMPPNAWKSKRASVYRFEAQLFDELKPGGEVVEKVLGE
ncbi:TIGR00296 family protein [Candidatus Micrarchaeota archaeon]|nr:MAG: TIGR00296 family protein [Candidatus Micrarchaeota archaeon]